MEYAVCDSVLDPSVLDNNQCDECWQHMHSKGHLRQHKRAGCMRYPSNALNDKKDFKYTTYDYNQFFKKGNYNCPICDPEGTKGIGASR